MKEQSVRRSRVYYTYKMPPFLGAKRQLPRPFHTMSSEPSAITRDLSKVGPNHTQRRIACVPTAARAAAPAPAPTARQLILSRLSHGRLRGNSGGGLGLRLAVLGPCVPCNVPRSSRRLIAVKVTRNLSQEIARKEWCNDGGLRVSSRSRSPLRCT